MNWGLACGGLLVGIVVGLTGMGGGALMTPMLILFFGINPLGAVSSDLVTTAIMKPFAGTVHAYHGTVNWALVGWLTLGSVPSAFGGVLVLRALGRGLVIEKVVTTALGIALLIAACSLIAKAYVSMTRSAQCRTDGEPDLVVAQNALQVTVRPLLTVLIGVTGGLVVGMTSVGSGSLMIIALMVLYPRLQASQLVGTDLIQAIPLVSAAALGHLLFGDFQLALTGSLLIGSIPGVILGAVTSSRAPGGLIRRALALVLLASGLTLLGVSTLATAIGLLSCVILGSVAWMYTRN